MNNGDGSQSETEQASGQRPTAERPISDDPAAPRQQNQADNGFQKTKQVAWRFVGKPIRGFANLLDPYSALLTALATIALAVLTYFLAVYANDLGRISGRQLTVMQGQLDVMKAQLAPKLALTIQRAQVKDASGNTGWIITPEWANNGGSEAVNFRGVDGFAITTEEQARAFNFQAGNAEYPSNVEPGDKIDQSTFGLSPEVVTAMNTKNNLGLLWGRITYEDAFPGSHLHHIYWCVRVSSVLLNGNMQFSFANYRPECNHRD